MTYGIIENGFCVNVIEAESEFAATIGAIPMQDGYGIGDYYDVESGTWHHEEPHTEAEKTIGRQITDLQLASIAQGQRQTALELAAIEQGQKITDVELEALKNV